MKLLCFAREPSSEHECGQTFGFVLQTGRFVDVQSRIVDGIRREKHWQIAISERLKIEDMHLKKPRIQQETLLY